LEKSIGKNLGYRHTRAVTNLASGLNRSTMSSTGDLNASKVHLEGSVQRETNIHVEEWSSSFGERDGEVSAWFVAFRAEEITAATIWVGVAVERSSLPCTSISSVSGLEVVHATG
jgi:hypothetical protein